MNTLSIVICSHNPRLDYFTRCLDALRSQTLPFNDWELILIDNCSDELLSDIFDLSWHPSSRIVREEKLGLTPARLRGIREANCDLLVFVDDDNVLDADYLEKARNIATEKPFLGAWSGQCRGVFETPPSEWTKRYFGNLVIREFDGDSWSNLPRLPSTMPCGAGLCIRRKVAQHYLYLNESGGRTYQFDRTGTSLVSGGDNDLAGCACALGLSVGLISALKLSHLIAPERLTVSYISRLAEGISFSSILLDREYDISIPKRSIFREFLDEFRLLRLNSIDRKIQQAALQGTRRAIKLVSQQ